MTATEPRSITRHCDVLVVGGSAAGLAAALQLGRQRRSVIVVDAGEPRNAPAENMHGFLGRDGSPPSSLVASGREEVRSYGVEVLDGRVLGVRRSEDRFSAELTGGNEIAARAVILATGVRDHLPDIDGVVEQWGRGVIHCPFCHGYEVRDRRIVQIVTHPMGLHASPLIRQLSSRLTIVVHDGEQVDPATLDALRTAGADVLLARATCVRSDELGDVAQVELDDGSALPADAVVVIPRFDVATAPIDGLGLTPTTHASGLGTFIETDAQGETAVPGVWAAGNVTDPLQQVLHAAADGSRVGAMVARSLADADLDRGWRASTTEEDWDRRYAGDRMWSGNPNGALVAEIADVEPGTALDVGAGEGGDAIWLAERGWAVTATDISSAGLARVGAEAAHRGLDVRCLHADTNAPDPFDSQRFDLVTAHYASIPRTTDDRAVHHLVEAVAPGGTLLVVTHDLEPMRAPIDTATASRLFDPDASLRVDDVLAALRDDPSWTIDVYERRPRPPGASSASHHVDDIVLRATRAET